MQQLFTRQASLRDKDMLAAPLPATMKATMRPILAAALLLIALQPLYAQQDDSAASHAPDFELQRFDWEGVPKPGTTLLLENRWGDIRLRQSGGEAVLMHAVMQKIGAQPRVAELKVDESNEQMALRIVYPEDQQPKSFQQGRVDVALVIPQGIAVEIVADRGVVSGKTLNNPIKVSATSNPVEFSSTASVDIQSDSGEVAIQFKPGPDEASESANQNEYRRGRIQTLSGNILISYQPGVEIGFDMISGSSKTTDDPRLMAQREYLQRRVLMRTSPQADMLQLQSDTGEIVLSSNQYRLGESIPEKQAAVDQPNQ